MNECCKYLFIECANGGSLPYSGLVEADLDVDGLDGIGPLPVILLVVHDS